MSDRIRAITDEIGEAIRDLRGRDADAVPVRFTEPSTPAQHAFAVALKAMDQIKAARSPKIDEE